MTPMGFNAPQGVTHDIYQRNDSEMVADELRCVLIRTVRRGVHSACFPSQEILLSTRELLPIPFPTTPVISAKKLRFHRCTDLDLWVFAKHSCQRSCGRLCGSNNDEVRPLFLVGLRDVVVPTSKTFLDGLITM
jgi:hypothetical protein